MKIKRSIGLGIGFTFSFAVIALSFQNCAQQQNMSSLSSSSNSGDATTDLSGDAALKASELDEPVPVDSKQTLESMMSLLNLSPADINKTEVNAEINYRRNLLAPRGDLAFISSPAMIAMTSLAGVVCKQAVAKEKKGTRDLFKFIDFTKGPSAYGKVGAYNTFAAMAQRFWMRNPTEDEKKAITETVDAYFSTLDATAMGKATESEKLATFICTGMLSLPESYLM
ncbi:hypothetical protein [Bdellovibrio svalbardensis]|uniref:Lipoprotein n=1 Tax=Bdellovibrio svalbardensis TaxID=2972972 RepID=A0ABT6DH34_9BACT|nr:hypothetical protein [Bdellovibrio svalbardensis]MDG0816126.1 hypothetical protein [Bdellovibrio svalbardensis]